MQVQEPSKVETLEEMCKLYMESRQYVDDIKAHLQKAQQELDKQEHKLMESMRLCGVDGLKIDGLGTFSVSTRMSVKTPKTPEAKELFFGYLKSLGVFDQLITVNSQTLNAWYKRELENAAESGNGNFQVPGLDEVTTYEVLSVRRS